MSNEEHLIENLIAYVQDIGWANVPSNPNSLAFYDLYSRYNNNGNTSVDVNTFCWLLKMAVYVVYHATVCNTDFSEDFSETGDKTND